ncbi:MAG: DUF6160 family protein [Pseudomonadota bacterium]
MTFRKLALASAVVLVPTTGFAAMVEMEEGSMADVTGQDGISLIISTPAITTDIYIHDKDGLAGAVGAYSLYSFDGAIVIDNFSYAGNMTITVDAGDNAQAGAAPTLNINVSIPTATIITGNISVANSQRDDVASGWGINTNSATLLNTMTIALSGLTMNIQLGNEPQGNMIAVASTVTNGISINSFALRDANSGGMIGASNILIKDTGASANLQLSVNANATAAGLVIGLAQVGSTTGMDIRITDARVGTTTSAAIGDISIVGLNVTGTTITLSGK